MMTKQLFLDQLTKLIACKSLPGNVAENKKAIDYVVSWLHSKAVVQRIVNGQAEILIAGNIDTMSPDVAYLVHMDVVDGKPEQFALQIDHDRLLGRGASDMKFSVPIGIALLDHLCSSGSKLAFALVITTDEEIGGPEGAKYLVEKMNFSPKLLIVPDGGDNLVFVNKAKGVCQIEIGAKGSPAHASRPWLGKNALEPLVKIAAELVEKFAKANKKESWSTTMNLGVISGGVSVNQVCPEAVVKLDFRFPETESVEAIHSEINRIAAKNGSELTVKLAGTGQPTFTDEKLPVVRRFILEMEKATGQKIPIKPTYGASDARWFANQKIPVLMIKPNGGDIHSDTEWVSLSSCLKFYEGLKSFLDTL